MYTMMANNNLDPKRLEEAASKLRAIAHPMRIAIIDCWKARSK
jgi:hypothetical protein